MEIRRPRRELVTAVVERVRRECGWDQEVIVPVDGLLRRSGVRIRWSPESLGRDGATTIRCAIGTITVLNPDDRDFPQRVRWSMCHELMHVLLQHLDDFSALHLSAEQEGVLCREADLGTSELLLPAGAVRHFIADRFPAAAGIGLLPREVGALKEHFQVSWQAMTIRLDELGIQDRHVTWGLFASQDGPLDEDASNVPAWAREEATHILHRRGPTAGSGASPRFNAQTEA